MIPKKEALLSLEIHIQNMEQRLRTAPDAVQWTFTRNGLRLALAAIEDEYLELYTEWKENKRDLGPARDKIRHEMLDVAACAMVAFMET